MRDDVFFNRRYRFDAMLKTLGIIAVSISCFFLVILFGAIIVNAIPAFSSYEVKVNFSSCKNKDEALKLLDNFIPSDNGNLEFFSFSAQDEITKLFENKESNKELWLPASSKLNNALMRDEMEDFDSDSKEVIKKLGSENSIKRVFDYRFFTSKESREPELAGVLTGAIGSLYTILVCLLAALPISVCAAIYLEEFAPKNIFTTLVEVNINNLAAVPSIVFGLLGLAVLINLFDFPRSAPITAGITLAMMIMPTMIITTRQALKVIPTTIRQAALALGATKIQIIMHHILPCAVPGIMTGVILSIARAIGETAPLILIGMLGFIVDIPNGVFDPATVMPVQIFLWADSPELGFRAKTSAAILLLLGILIFINMIAVYIRKKYEHRW